MLSIYNKDSKSSAALSANKKGGIFYINGKDDNSKIALSVVEGNNGGILGVFGKGDIAKAVISIGEHDGRGYARGNDGKSMARLGVDENGGYVIKTDEHDDTISSLHGAGCNQRHPTNE